jgi:hypothetical protein
LVADIVHTGWCAQLPLEIDRCSYPLPLWRVYHAFDFTGYVLISNMRCRRATSGGVHPLVYPRPRCSPCAQAPVSTFSNMAEDIGLACHIATMVLPAINNRTTSSAASEL